VEPPGRLLPGAKFTGTYAGTISLIVMSSSALDFSGATLEAT
jgi:hypothetical protein